MQDRPAKNLLKLIIILMLLFSGIFFISSYSLEVLEETKPSWVEEQLRGDQSSVIYDREGSVIAVLHGVEDRRNVSISDIPEHITWAFVVVEDIRFYEHEGLDFKALGRAVIANIEKGFGSEGASTITQQLVKNAILSPEKSFNRKLKEAWLAKELESEYSKQEILEMYLNRIYFGHGAYGIKAAAQVYFGKEPGDLTISEAAVLAGIPNSPASYSPYLNPQKAKERKERVLGLLYEQKKIAREAWVEALQEPINLVGLSKKNQYQYPYFIDHVIEEAISKINLKEDALYRGGLHIYTSLEPKLQKSAEEVWSRSENFPRGSVGMEAAFAVVDHRTGEILALVGGREYQARRGFNRATQLKRQPGSTFKPIAAYGPAIELGYPPFMYIEDSPQTFGKYQPSNYGGRYRGYITMEQALQWSANLPAVKLLNLISVEEGYDFANRLGFKLKKEDRGLQLALGGLTDGTSPLEMARAYGAFANGGYLCDSRAILKVVDSSGKILYDKRPPRTKVMQEQTSHIITQMLKKAVEGGTGTRARILGHEVAGKTGTTQLPDTLEFKSVRGNKDAWFVGYTPAISAAVWMGYDQTTSEKYLKGIVGGSYPAQLWKKVLEGYLQSSSPKQFPRYTGELKYRGDFQVWKKPKPEIQEPPHNLDTATDPQTEIGQRKNKGVEQDSHESNKGIKPDAREKFEGAQTDGHEKTNGTELDGYERDNQLNEGSEENNPDNRKKPNEEILEKRNDKIREKNKERQNNEEEED